jgi:phosphatidylserine/phosphatidylglycerophosphate/cardiolipin synthase-like enzyme
VRIWRDASEAARLSDVDVEAQLGGHVEGLDIRSNSPGGELMHLKGYCMDHRLLRTGSSNFSRSGKTRQDNDLVALRGAAVCRGFDVAESRSRAIERTIRWRNHRGCQRTLPLLSEQTRFRRG